MTTRFSEICEGVKSSNDYEHNSRLLHYLGNVLSHDKKLTASEGEYLAKFAVSEMEKLITVIPQQKSYKEKDKIFSYEDSLLMVYSFTCRFSQAADEHSLAVIKRLVELVGSECAVENSVDDMFKLSAVNKTDVEKVLKTLEPIRRLSPRQALSGTE